MKQALLTFGILAACAAAACRETAEDRELHDRSPSVPAPPADDDDEDELEVEETIALDALPPAVRAAALAAVPGLVITHAEKETEGSDVHYCIHGTAGGDAVEVEVSPDGQKVEVEHDEDEDGEDGDDDGEG